MTIDEAIKHCLEVAERQEISADDKEMYSEMLGEDYKGFEEGCQECAADHRQLAEWLTELKELREQNAELKSILNAALKDIHGKDICEVMNACKLCAMKFQQLCDIFPWQHANEALKLLGEDGDY